MEIHHIRYFLAVCETRNFTSAANLCNVAQSAVSRAVQQLEEEVGGQLLRRERNKTSLTELGLMMKPRLQNIISELSVVKQEARRFLTLEKADLNLGVMCTIGPTRFAGLLVHFTHTHPGVSLQISEGVPSSLCDKLDAGQIDIALMTSPQGFHERFAAQQLYRERFVVAFPVGHRFEAMDLVPIAAVHGENYLRRLNCEYAGRLSELADAVGAEVHLGHASEHEDWIQNMVVGGLGICFIPEFSALAPGLHMRPLTGPEVWREVCLVTMAGRRLSPAVSSFLKALDDYPFPGSKF